MRAIKGKSCVLLINISRGAAHTIPHSLQQLQRLKSCPASNYDCIPEIRQGNGVPVMFFLGRIIPFIESIRSELASKYSHTSSAVVLMTISLWHLEWNKRQLISAADASAAARCSVAAVIPLPCRLVRVCGTHAGLGYRALLAGCYRRKINIVLLLIVNLT